jgi:phosphoribosylformylglycinamidine synthase
MAGKGGLGIEIDLDAVPQREEGMSAYEMMLSESQERMLAILKPGREDDARRVFAKWGLDAAVIGHTTETGRLVLHHQGRRVCDIPLAPLTEDAPQYDRPRKPSSKPQRLHPAEIPPPGDWRGAVLTLLSCPDMASKRWIWEQYDHHVMADTLADSSTAADAALVRVHGTRKALALTSDVTPRYVAADPYEGGKQAVAEAWRNLTAVGAEPIAITDNLNFGNPERPEVMASFVGAVEGMAEACRALDFPVVSGNVSLYNETNGVAIPPTPTVGAVGLIADYARHAGYGGLKAGDALVLIGVTHGELGASLYLREVLGREDGAPPPVDLELERRNGDFVRSLIASGQVKAVHDLSDGGLIAAAAEMALASGVGITLRADSAKHAHLYLFGEDQGRYLLSSGDPEAVLEAAHRAGVPASLAGQAGGDALASPGLFEIQLSALRAANEGWLPAYMSGPGHVDSGDCGCGEEH